MLNKSTQNSATSCTVSFLVHLLLMLLISGFWFVGNRGRAIELTGATESPTEFKQVSINLDQEPVDLLAAGAAAESIPDVEESLEHVLQLNDENLISTEALDDSDFVSISDGENDFSDAKSGSGSASGADFFGTRPTGNRIVYIIDISFSMGEGKYKPRLNRAIDEVVSSVNNLSEEQEFFVILFSFGTFPIELKSGATFVEATEANKKLLESRLASVGLSGGTDPRDALVRALKLNPSCVFLLTDGEFNGGQHRNPPYGNRVDAYQLSVQHNNSECPINTICLEDHRSEKLLTKISEKSGGTFVFVTAED